MENDREIQKSYGAWPMNMKSLKIKYQIIFNEVGPRLKGFLEPDIN